MKKILLMMGAALLAVAARSQEVVSWDFSAKKISGGKYEVHMKASVQAPWHTYSQTTPLGGPLPTKFTFGKNPLLTTEGTIKEQGEMRVEHDRTFDVDVRYFLGSVDFVQVVSLKGGARTKLSGKVEFMACKDRQCLPPKTVPFSIAIP